MYIVPKDSDNQEQARIAWMEFSRAGKSVYYDGRLFVASDNGYPSNYDDTTNGDQYWIAECNPDGKDRKYKNNLPTLIEEDARQEYWTVIRKMPENADQETV